MEKVSPKCDRSIESVTKNYAISVTVSLIKICQ